MADEMLRIAGRDSNGFAKAIKTDNSGNVTVQLIGSKFEEIIYSNSNPLALTSGTHYRPRDTIKRSFYIDQLNAGVFEQTLTFYHNLGVNLNVEVFTEHKFNAEGWRGISIWSGIMPNDSRFMFAPERSPATQDTETRRIIEIPELRLPIRRFWIDVTPQTAPTSGDLYIQVCRRF